MPELLTTREAAEYLRQSESTLAHWRVAGTGPRTVRIGRRVLYRRDDLAEFVEKSEHSMRCHRVETVRRGDWTDEGGVTHAGYAARCTECSAITFGGFASRSAARAALRDHEREADK